MEALFAALGWLKWLVGWLGWFGIGATPLAITAAIIWFFPLLRTAAALVAIGWALAFGSYTLGDINGAARITDEWKAAERRDIKQGSTAREQAERDIPPVPDRAAVGGRGDPPEWVRNDPDNRDNH
jgi:hypothetical protein